MNTTSATPAIIISEIQQPKMLVDNLRHIHDHGIHRVEFYTPKLAKLIASLRAANDGKLVLRAGQSRLTIEKVGRVTFTLMHYAVGEDRRYNVHYDARTPKGEPLSYTWQAGDSDERQVMRAVILGEALPQILRPATGSAQDDARKFARSNAWLFLGEKGLHMRACERQRGLVQSEINVATERVDRARRDKCQFEQCDFGAQIERCDVEREHALNNRKTAKGYVAAYRAHLASIDPSTLPVTTPRALWERLSVQMQVRADSPTSTELAVTWENAQRIRQSRKAHADACTLIFGMANGWRFGEYFGGVSYFDVSHDLRFINEKGVLETYLLGNNALNTTVIRGTPETWSHTQTKANYTAILVGEEIRLSSGVVCPFTASTLLAFLRGEVKRIPTQYGGVKRIETRDGDKAKVLVSCGCHTVDVSVLSDEFATACEPRHVITHVAGVPDLEVTQDNWPAVLARINAHLDWWLGENKVSTVTRIQHLARAKHEASEALNNRDAKLAEHDAAIATVEGELARVKIESERKLASVSYEWQDETQATSFVTTLVNMLAPVKL